MMTFDDCLRAAFAALLRGDLKERDRLCGLATNIANARKRIEQSGSVDEITIGEPILLKHERTTCVDTQDR